MDDVTVVIPAFNNARTLGRTLTSSGLTTRGLRVRVLVVDNGSEDDTIRVARQLGAEVAKATRPGPASARNLGLVLADSEFVAFLDADCVPDHSWLDVLYKAIAASGHIGIGGRIKWQTSNLALRAFYDSEYPNNASSSSQEVHSYLLTGNAIFRREQLLNAGGLDPRLNWCEDLELGIRLSAAGATIGYAVDAVVNTNAASGCLELFAQFFKYGSGLMQVSEMHPGVFGWSFRAECIDLLHRGRRLIRGDLPREQIWFGLLARMAYLAGTVERRLRLQLARTGAGGGRPVEVLRRVPQSEGRRGVAITLDDGPTPEATPGLLAALRRHQTRATFFVLGERVAAHPHLIPLILREGHDVYAHGYNHRPFDCLSRADICDELTRTEALLAHSRPTPASYCVRLPYGRGADDPHVHRSIRSWNPAARIVQWSADLEDWKMAGACASSTAVEAWCAEAIRGLLARGDLPGSILLLHDGPQGIVAEGSMTDGSVLLLERVLDALRDNGYETFSLRGPS